MSVMFVRFKKKLQFSGQSFRKKGTKIKITTFHENPSMCFFSTNSVRNISHSKKNWARYYREGKMSVIFVRFKKKLQFSGQSFRKKGTKIKITTFHENPFMCFFSTNLSETFLILRRTERDFIVNVKCPLCLSGLKRNFNILGIFFKKRSEIKNNHISRKSIHVFFLYKFCAKHFSF